MMHCWHGAYTGVQTRLRATRMGHKGRHESADQVLLAGCPAQRTGHVGVTFENKIYLVINHSLTANTTTTTHGSSILSLTHGPSWPRRMSEARWSELAHGLPSVRGIVWRSSYIGWAFWTTGSCWFD